MGSNKVSPDQNAIKNGRAFLGADDRFFHVLENDKFESQKVEVPQQVNRSPPPSKEVEKEEDEKYSEQLMQIEAMGFSDKKKNTDALDKARGDVEVAINILSTDDPEEIKNIIKSR